MSENFISLSTLPMMIQLSGKSTNFGSKNISLLRKQLIGKVESFVKSNFDLKKEYKIELTQNY